jgi:flagellar protein FliS
MQPQFGAARYRTVRSHGLVETASPTRLVQITFEHILAHLSTAQGCMLRIKDNRPLADVVAKNTAVGKAMRLISHLDGSLDMEKGEKIAADLRALYDYMLRRLALANANNDPAVVDEVVRLVRDIKFGWDQIVTDAK